jgi:hypothetical protein
VRRLRVGAEGRQIAVIRRGLVAEILLRGVFVRVVAGQRAVVGVAVLLRCLLLPVALQRLGERSAEQVPLAGRAVGHRPRAFLQPELVARILLEGFRIGGDEIGVLLGDRRTFRERACLRAGVVELAELELAGIRRGVATGRTGRRGELLRPRRQQ